MDSQVDKNLHLQDLPKLREGERVEVRQKDVGLRGSWHPGTIVALKAGRCVVEYDELLTDDGISKLRESIPCAKLIEKPTSSPGICTPHKNTASVAACMRSPSKKRGLLRPSPPLCTEPAPLAWKGGLFVDVFYQDAWWEAVLLNGVTSLDDDALVDVIYPDEGDLARVHAKDLRISQFWDEFTGEWSIKGSTNLTKFLNRRGIRRNEVSLMVDRLNPQNSCTHSEVTVCEKELIPVCPASDSRQEAVPSSVNELHEEPLLLHSHQNVAPDSLSTEKDIDQNPPVMCTRNDGMVLDSSAAKVCLDASMTPGRGGQATYEESQNPNSMKSDSKICDNGKSGHGSEKVMIEREDVGECLPASLVKDEFVYDNLRSKRRRIEDACAISCEREAVYSCSQPTASSPSRNHCPLQNHHLETFKLIRDEPGFGKEQSLDRGSTSYPDIVRNRGQSNLKGSSNCYSAKVCLESAVQQSFGSEESDVIRKETVSLFSRGILGGKKTYKKKNKKNKLSNTRPMYKEHLLALEAPVQKSQEEYEQITSAGKPAPERGVHERAMRPARPTGKEAPSRKSREQCDQSTPIGKPVLEEGVYKRAIRPGRQIIKVSPSEKSREECDRISLAGKAASNGGVDERAVMTRRQAGKESQKKKERQTVKEGSVRKSQEENNQVALAGKAMSGGGVRERAKSGRRARTEMPIQGSRQEYDQTISTGKALLKGDVQERVMRRGRRSGVKALGWKSEEENDQIISRKASPELDVHKRVMRFGGQAEGFSRPVDKIERRGRKDTLKSFKERLVRQKQADALKRKASKMSSISEMGGKSAKVLKVSGPHREPNQPETATVSCLSNCKKLSLKSLAREIGKKAVLEAGFTIEYRLRRGKLSHDAIYTSPKGSSYWSLPKAWQALGKQGRKGKIRVEKAVVQQVLSMIDGDEKMRSAFEKLDRFSGTCLQDVMRKASFTYEELTDILLEDLRVLKKTMPFKKKKHGNLQKRGRGKIINICSDLKNGTYSKPLLVASKSFVVKQRGGKRKQDVETLLQEVNGRTSMSKFSSNSEDLQGGYVRKLEKNRSGSREGKQRTWLKGVNKAPVNKGRSLIKALTEKIRNNLRGSSKSTGIEVRTSKQESRKKKEKSQKPRSGFRLEVRPSSLSTDDESEDLSCRSKRTVASWMIDRGAVLEKERIFYVDQTSNEILKEGVLTREGILCRCCKKVYTVQNFEEHGGSLERAPHCNLIFTSGRSFLDCQLEAWNVEVQIRKTYNYKGVTANDTNDDTCLLCGDGGSLLCCDLCPSTFHASCLQLDNVPEGNWYCPKCRCGVCRGRNGSEEDDSMAVCRQCEHRYHVACLCGGHTIVENNFFCGNLCRKIYLGLQKLIGVTQSLERGFSWTLLRCMEEGDGSVSYDTKLTMKNNSKLAVALLVLKECFNPMDDPRTNIDLITHALYNRRSQFDRLNYVGFYTAVLERNDEIISVASIRIHGARVAEMPLIGTRHKYRRQGMCRLLVGVIEKLLSSLEVGTFILPAIPELFETWTQAFGFRPLDSSQRSDIKDLSMMMFPGTDLLQKPMLKISTGNTAVLQVCDSAAELPSSVDANSVDGCQKSQSAGSRRMADIGTDPLAQIADLQVLQNDDGDGDKFFDACLNLQSTDSSMMAEMEAGSVLNLSSGSPTGGASPSAEAFSMGMRVEREPSSNFWQTHLASSGECDSANAEVFLNETRDDGLQEREISCVSLKGVTAKDSSLETGNVELQKMEQSSDCNQVDGGCNGLLNAETVLHDTWDGKSQQSELRYRPEQLSEGSFGIGSRDWESLKMKSESAEPMLNDSSSLANGNSRAIERLERGCGLQSSRPSSDCKPPVSVFTGAGGSLNAIAPSSEARIGGSLRPEQSTKTLGTDASISAYTGERAVVTHKPEPSPDSSALSGGVSVIAKGNLFSNSNDSDLEKSAQVSDPMQIDPISLREIGLLSTKGPFLESRDVDIQKLELISEANRTDTSPCGGSSVEGPLIEEGIVACKS